MKSVLIQPDTPTGSANTATTVVRQRLSRSGRPALVVAKAALATVGLSAGLLTVTAAEASAATRQDQPSRGDGWKPLAFPPYDWTCGATIVHVSAPVNREFYRETVLANGTVRWHVTGSLRLEYATDTGQVVTVNSSGPGQLLQKRGGDVQVLAKGLNSYNFTPEQAATLGVPQISVSAGPIDVTWHPDGTVSGHLGNIIEDVCAELT
jgi:hypothetical protein